MMSNKRFIHILILSIILAVVFSCTDYQEENVPEGLSVDSSKLSFGSGYTSSGESSSESLTRTVKVRSGTRWKVGEKPSWLSVQAIDAGSAAFEWEVSFTATQNGEYDRQGTVKLTTGTKSQSVAVSQEGRRGTYVAVDTVFISPESLSLTVGESSKLTASIYPKNASESGVSWSSNNLSVATVSSSGEVTAVKAGKATITVKTNDGGKTATCAVTVNAAEVPVTGVSLNTGSLTMTEGETQTLSATVSPSNATDKSVTWSSNNTSVATVSSSGVVTAVKAGSATITVKTNNGGKTATCSVTVKAAEVPVTGVSINKTSLTMTEGETQTLTATVKPDNATDKSVTWSSNNTSVATVSSSGVVTAIKTGSATITVKTNNGGKTATCAVTVKNAEAVDLGLPSGLKWGSCNIGASSPEEYGDYYAWGETSTKSNYSWETYKWGSYNSLTKYNTSSSYGTVDNNTKLDNSDDVARVKLGGKWRMPTDDEWTELRTKCTWTWTTQNGVYGRKVTGPNGNSIFLPAAGYRDGTSLDSAGSYGYYWSSSLYTVSPYCAWFVYFYSGGVGRYYSYRCLGQSVRPVSE